MRIYLFCLTGIVLILGLSVSFLFDREGTNVTAPKVERKIPTQILFSEKDKSIVFDDDEKAINQVIEEYCGLAKQGRFSDLEKQIVKVSIDEFLSFEENNDIKEKKGTKRKSAGESIDPTPFSDFLYERLKSTPSEVIYEGQWEVYKISQAQKIKNKAKVQVELKADREGNNLMKQTYYLIKNSKGEWKIYRIEFSTSNSGKEKTANESMPF